jgi:hypothetical protein
VVLIVKDLGQRIDEDRGGLVKANLDITDKIEHPFILIGRS